MADEPALPPVPDSADLKHMLDEARVERDLLEDMPVKEDPKYCTGSVIYCEACGLQTRKLNVGRPCIRCAENTVKLRACKAMALAGAPTCAAHTNRVTRAAAVRRSKAKAVKNRVEKAKQKWAEENPPPEDDPIASLQYQHEQSGRIVHWVGQVLDAYAELEEDIGERSGAHRGIYDLWIAERERHGKLAKMLVDANVAERQVAIAETQGALIASAIGAVIDSAELGLSPSQKMHARRLAGQALREAGAA